VKPNGRVFTCDWVSKKPNKRCKVMGSSNDVDVRACDACLTSCMNNPCPTAPPCLGDDPDWGFTRGGRERNCNWVKQKPNKRCRKRGSDNVRACEGCCESCSDYPCV